MRERWGGWNGAKEKRCRKKERKERCFSCVERVSRRWRKAQQLWMCSKRSYPRRDWDGQIIAGERKQCWEVKPATVLYNKEGSESSMSVCVIHAVKLSAGIEKQKQGRDQARTMAEKAFLMNQRIKCTSSRWLVQKPEVDCQHLGISQSTAMNIFNDRK